MKFEIDEVELEHHVHIRIIMFIEKHITDDIKKGKVYQQIDFNGNNTRIYCDVSQWLKELKGEDI
jgi:hypothetical protein